MIRPTISRLLTSLALIVLVALALRLAYAYYDAHQIPLRILAEVPFLYEPGHIAFSLATGRGFSSPFGPDTGPTAWTTPIYPLILAGIFDIFGTFTFPAYVAAISLNILFSTLTCMPIYFAGKRIGGLTVASIAAWLWALFPNAVIIPSQWIWDTSLSGLLVALILWATLAWADSSRAWKWCAYGLLWGLTLMTDATLLAGLPFLLGWMAWRLRKGSPGNCLKKPLFACAMIVLTCIPWTVRNYLAFHSFIPLRTGLGLQLWLGNNDAYRDAFPGWLHPIDNAAEREKYIAQGEVAYMAQKRHEAISWMFSHPGREAHLFAQRFTGTWFGTAHPFADFLCSKTLLLRTIFISDWLVVIAALVGAVLVCVRREGRGFAVPLTAFPIFYPFAFYFSLALFRYRYPIDPAIILLAAIAFSAFSPGRLFPEEL
ncbi:MAG TPA: hypothetical protein VMH00_15910 [Candidatus Limnocylindrales bacterium]|nr:hypothetical protein [Candidatus Limnocylindrales bacterium]